jgi:hypothetical protein
VASGATALVVIALLAVLPFPRIHRAVPVETVLALSTEYSLDTAAFANTSTALRWHPQPRLAPARGDAITFSGWAADDAERAPITVVQAVVDGGAMFPAAVTGLRRADVALKLGNPAFAASGFRLTIPPCALSAGAHRIAFRFEAADRRGYYRSRDDVDIDVNGGPPPTRVAYAVDAIVPPMSQRGEHEARGWVVDTGSCSASLGVRFTVDGRQVASARYGLARPDVARALGLAAYARSGFDATWSDATLARGPHTLRLEAILRSGQLRRAADTGFALRFSRS